MLGKIMKYDFKALCRYLLPIYAILIGSSIALRLCIEITQATDGSFLGGILAVLFGLTFGLSTLVTLFSVFVIIIIHFYKTLLSDQGYFYLALPVSYDAHLISKILMGAVFIVLSLFALFVSLIPFFVGNVELPAILNVFKNIFEVVGEVGKYPYGIPCMILMLLIYLFGFQIKVYFCIFLGQLWQKHRILGAFLAYIATGLVLRIAASILSINSFNALKLIVNPENIFSKPLGLLLEVLVFYALVYALEYILTRFILKRKLNLE